MSHYITSTLEEGEQIVLRGRLHWSAVSQYLFFALLLLLVAAGLVAGGYFSARQELYGVAAVCLVLAVAVYVVGRVVRTKTEFAVTTNRFVQKDGILNIQMMEMPLFKIETVNFYQSFWQRVLGTGSIELVGSGGTCHRVNCIENPLLVRKTIVSAINKNGKRENE